MTVQELLDLIDDEGLEPGDEVLFVSQPDRHPLVYHISGGGAYETTEGEYDDSPEAGYRLYLIEGSQRRNSPYLTSDEHDALGL